MNKLFYFSGNNCAPCATTKIVLGTIDYIEVIEFDIHKNQDVAEKYNVMTIPTLILVDEDNNELDRKIGFTPKVVLDEWIKSVK